MFSHRSEVSVSEPLVYDIRVAGVLDASFSDYVRGMRITRETDTGGDPVTVVHGVCPDHAALVGIMHTLGNFGLTILGVRCLGAPGAEAAATGAEPTAEGALESVEPAVALAAAGGVAITAGASKGLWSRLHPAGNGGLGAGTGLIVGGLLTAGGPPCILAGAVAGALIGGLAASLLGKTVEDKK